MLWKHNNNKLNNLLGAGLEQKYGQNKRKNLHPHLQQIGQDYSTTIGSGIFVIFQISIRNKSESFFFLSFIKIYNIKRFCNQIQNFHC